MCADGNLVTKHLVIEQVVVITHLTPSLLLHCQMRQPTSSYYGSLDRRLASLEGIPLDTVHHVAYHTSVEDLVVLSTVRRSI
jgi:hypothetical protein